MNSNGARKSYECEKALQFVTRFWKLKRNLTMVFKPMVSLCIGICCILSLLVYVQHWSIFTAIFKTAINFICQIHCVKSVRIWSFSGPHFPHLDLKKRDNTDTCGKIRARKTPNTDTFHTVIGSN